MKVLVVGDSCEDVFEYGKCTRLCPDAPVPVFIPRTINTIKGMAGNVANNLIALGATPTLITNEEKIIKKRLVDEKTNQMIVRVDSGEEKIQRISNLQQLELGSYAAIVISDYNKGFLYEDDIQFLCENHELVFMDTKKILGNWAKECNFIKINEIEHRSSSHYINHSDNSWIQHSLITTLGAQGCRFKDIEYPVSKVEIKDQVGAGDTFISALVAKYLQTKDISEAIIFANSCATYVVQQRGVEIINELYRVL
jgi:bifunctional ADP-heptose synthase (sugar kinase/adenylyltransferase)